MLLWSAAAVYQSVLSTPENKLTMMQTIYIYTTNHVFKALYYWQLLGMSNTDGSIVCWTLKKLTREMEAPLWRKWRNKGTQLHNSHRMHKTSVLWVVGILHRHTSNHRKGSKQHSCMNESIAQQLPLQHVQATACTSSAHKSHCMITAASHDPSSQHQNSLKHQYRKSLH